MTDTYQAVYEAALRRMSNGDIGQAVENAVNLQLGNAGYLFGGSMDSISIAACEMQRPSVLYRPELGIDGNQWCALYGLNLMEGVAGFGDTPDKAMRDFDDQFSKAKTPQVQP